MATKDIPIYERTKTIDSPGGIPDFQGAYREKAQIGTTLSEIGASVAQSASNAMAQQLGYEAGKHPTGDIGPSFTEFDKNFAETYNNQAAATLSIQGQTLMDGAHTTLSKAPRLTPELLATTHANLTKGLADIAANAPMAVRGQLEKIFASQMLTQMGQYQDKMITEQRTDEKNNLVDGIGLSTNAAYELASKGDFNGAKLAADRAASYAQSGQNSVHFSPDQARSAREAATQARLNGEQVYIATAHYKNGTYAEFEKYYAENKPANMTNEQWVTAGKAFQEQIRFLQGLKAEDENIKSQQMLNRIVTNPAAITNTEWNEYAASVSPLKREQVRFHYLQALKSNETTTIARDNLIKGWDNPEVQAMAGPQLKNDTFYKLVDNVVQKSQQPTIPLRANPISRDQAEVQVLSNAGAEIPAATASLKGKLASPNPAFVDSAVQQIRALKQSGNGQVLKGLNEQDWAMYTAQESLRDSPDPLKAYQEAHNRIYGQDVEVEKLNKQKWANILSKQNSAGVPNDDYALSQFNLSKSDFVNPTIATAYGLNILNKFSNFFSISGNFEEAKRSTKRWVDENYGETFINGQKYTTLNPIEKKVGFKGRDGTPYIQQDVVNQFNAKLAQRKEDYKNPKKTGINEYWEALPIDIQKPQSPTDILKNRVMNPIIPELSLPDVPKDLAERSVAKLITPGRDQSYQQPEDRPSQQHGVFFNTYEPIKMKRVMRTKTGEKVDIFNVILNGNPYGDYDVAIETRNGMRNLFLEAPHLGIVTVSPNIQGIRDSYNKDHSFK